MADYTLENVGIYRAIAEIEVDVTGDATFEAPIDYPIDALGDLDTEEFSIIVTPLDALAAGGHYVDGAVQDQVTGYITWTLHNVTAGQQGDVGTFRVDVQRHRLGR